MRDSPGKFVCQEPCKNKAHCPQIPHDVVYKTYAAGGARFNHPDKTKDLEKLFKDALSFRPHTLVIYFDAIMNSLTLPPHAPPNASTLTPEEVLQKLLLLQRECRGRFIVVLCRRKLEDAIKLQRETNRKKGDPERLFRSNLDNDMNVLIKQHFQYFDLKLSNSSFKTNSKISFNLLQLLLFFRLMLCCRYVGTYFA